jgi:hypothetical protein
MAAAANARAALLQAPRLLQVRHVCRCARPLLLVFLLVLCTVLMPPILMLLLLPGMMRLLLPRRWLLALPLLL